MPVSREHRRAKTDRLDTEQLKRSFLGWLRGERDHCKMAAIPTFAEEDAGTPVTGRCRMNCNAFNQRKWPAFDRPRTFALMGYHETVCAESDPLNSSPG